MALPPETLFEPGVSLGGKSGGLSHVNTGLGLSHVREIVHDMGWSVSIRNVRDGGACVSIKVSEAAHENVT